MFLTYRIHRKMQPCLSLFLSFRLTQAVPAAPIKHPMVQMVQMPFNPAWCHFNHWHKIPSVSAVLHALNEVERVLWAAHSGRIVMNPND